MGDIVNLRRVRKQKAKDVMSKVADANRLIHGQTKAEKERAKSEIVRFNKTLDGHKRSDE